MGFTQSLVLGATSFSLGILLVSQIVDIPLLYNVSPDQTLFNKSLQDAYTFYETWYNAPKAVKAVMHTAMIIPIFALGAKLNKLTESAIFFDGSSLGLHMVAVILYLTVHIPYLRVFIPLETLYPQGPATIGKTSGPLAFINPPWNQTLADQGGHSENDKVEAVRVVAAGNALMCLCLVGILAMQAGQEYARRTEEREQRLLDLKTVNVASPASPGIGEVVEDKKTQ